MSGLSLRSITPAENEFLAEDTIIGVISAINHPKFRFLSGEFGPLEAGLPCDVPLWLAMTLRKKGMCMIVPPDWMTVAQLEQYIQNERTVNAFEPLPFHYLEISKLLLAHAKEDVPYADQVSALIQDLENIRMDRLKISALTLAERVKNGEGVYTAKVENISSMEIFAIKGFMTESMSIFRRLTIVNDGTGASGRSTSGTTTGSTTATTAGGTFGGSDIGAAAGGGRKLRKFRNDEE